MGGRFERLEDGNAEEQDTAGKESQPIPDRSGAHSKKPKQGPRQVRV